MEMSDTITTGGDVPTSDTVIYRPGEIVEKHESCDGEVRWNSGVLEQLWYTLHVGTSGAIEKTTEDWRPVPSV